MYKYFLRTITLPVTEAKLSIFALLHVHNVCIAFYFPVLSTIHINQS